ncbi:hypothetical protein FISHEDRAFT_34248 [Fistulina hepatica ATCC 64428]|uniref:Uncharacterized protein n=1 Tax=Fistulina hepatica ATCC 64428 TaxID=1128425 RepID=A0A0D7ANW4_9AGAR|nr:hypothetical protein FISHEDRAFT_34248 [Fistulina hepatica ATCC 64428]
MTRDGAWCSQRTTTFQGRSRNLPLTIPGPAIASLSDLNLKLYDDECSRRPARIWPSGTYRRSVRCLLISSFPQAYDLACGVLPNELLELTIHFFVDSYVRHTTPPKFSLMSPLSLASKGCRRTSLRIFFSRIIVTSQKQWNGVFKLLVAQTISDPALDSFRSGGSCHASALDWTSVSLSRRLNFFRQLKRLSTDFYREGLSTQHDRLKLILNTLNARALSCLCVLTLTSLPRTDPKMLRLIAQTLPGLEELYLSCIERLDFNSPWYCLQESLSCTIHSPIPSVCCDHLRLATSYANELTVLRRLSRLHIGVFLSDEQLLECHIDHAELVSDRVPSFDGCAICHESRDIVQRRESEAAIYMARFLPSLKSMGWSSLFHGPREQQSKSTTPGVEDDRRGKSCRLSTRVEIIRRNRSITCRRVE